MKTLMPFAALLPFVAGCGLPGVPLWLINVRISLECPPGARCEPFEESNFAFDDSQSCAERGAFDALFEYSATFERGPEYSEWTGEGLPLREHETVGALERDGGLTVPRYESNGGPGLYRVDTEGQVHAVSGADAEVSIDGNTITTRYRSRADGRFVFEQHEVVQHPDNPCRTYPGDNWGP